MPHCNQRIADLISLYRREDEIRAVHLAWTDSLTALPNRRHFLETIRKLSEKKSIDGFFLVQIDIDRFRSHNSVHGPDTGDAILVEMARRLLHLAPFADLVARTACNEFSVLVGRKNCDTGPQELAASFHSQLKAPMSINGRNIVLDLSIAICESGPTPSNETAMLLEGDAAMQNAKRDGGDRVAMFDDAIAEQIRENVRIKSDLTKDIPLGEIVPFFQPTVSFRTGEVEGAEVLARWQHPTRGLVSPAVFIPAAEETGLVDDLFWAMLPVACLAALKCSEPVNIAVNLSPAQVLDRWFPQKVLAKLTKAGFPPRRFEIEMTETALFADMSATQAALASLRNQGVGVALDDFGVGYSCLSLLRTLPITKVKIDRSFVAEILVEEKAANLVRSLIDLCGSLGLQVTAEGIEDEATAVKLRDWGCDYGQGYWFARPAAELSLSTPWCPMTDRVAA